VLRPFQQVFQVPASVCSPHQIQTRFGQLQAGNVQPSAHQRRKPHHRRNLTRSQHGLGTERWIFEDDEIVEVKARLRQESKMD